MILRATTDRASTSDQERLSIVWIGHGFYSEFHDSYSALLNCFQIKLATNPAAVLAWAKNPVFTPPALIVLAEDYPRQFTETELGELNSRWPLTQFVQIVGDWCEGDPRSRFAQPFVIRILKDEFPLWIERSLQQQSTGLAPSWQQPATSSMEHHWLEQNPLAHTSETRNEAQPKQLSISRIAVLSHSLEDQFAITESLKSFGFCNENITESRLTSIRFLDFLKRQHDLDDSASDQPDLIIANSHNGLERELDSYRLLHSQWPNTRWLFLVNFPRSQDVELLHDWPKSRVLPKPCSLAMLETALNDFIP
jgi:hypothetical protein